jgi:hypothetical protein
LTDKKEHLEKERIHASCLDSGYCEAHGVEIERRKGLEAMASQIPRILTAVNKMIGFSVLATVIILGGFAYTRDVSSRSETADKEFQAKLEKVSYQISELVKSVAITEARHDSLVDQLKELNHNLEREYKHKEANGKDK